MGHGANLLRMVACGLLLAGCNADQKRFVELSNKGVETLAAQDYQRAEGYFLEAAKLRPHDAELHYYLGTIALRDHRAKDAATRLHEAATLDPKWPDAHLNLARALIEDKRMPEALVALDHLFAVDPGHPNGHLLVAQIALGDGHATAADRRKADEQLRAAIAGDVKFALAYLELSHLYADVGAYEAALQVLDAGLKFSPDSVELQEALGLAWLDLGRPDRARPILEQASNHPRARYGVFLNLAAALLQVGDKPAAIQALRTYIVQGTGQQADQAQLRVAGRMLKHLKDSTGAE